MRALRQALHKQLDPTAIPRPGLSHLNLAIAVFVVFAVAVSVLETEPSIATGREALFNALEQVFTAVFAVEYAMRLWTAAERDPQHPWRARWRWVLTPIALIDLAALLTLFLASGGSATLLRLARILRIARLAKLGRLSRAASLLLGALAARRAELTIAAVAAGIAVLIAATVMYVIEGPLQPDKFGSIPRAMWWAVVTLTTVGYGDVYPLSPLGKVVAGLTGICGIVLIAAPTGILAAAFTDALQKHRESAQTLMSSSDPGRGNLSDGPGSA